MGLKSPSQVHVYLLESVGGSETKCERCGWECQKYDIALQEWDRICTGAGLSNPSHADLYLPMPVILDHVVCMKKCGCHIYIGIISVFTGMVCSATDPLSIVTVTWAGKRGKH